MRYTFELSSLVGKVPNYYGSLLDRPGNDIENVKAFCEEHSLGIDSRYSTGLMGYTFDPVEAAKIITLKLGLPDTLSVVFLDTSVSSIHKLILESGFSEADYSVIIEDNLKFLVAKSEVLVMLKLIK